MNLHNLRKRFWRPEFREYFGSENRHLPEKGKPGPGISPLAWSFAGGERRNRTADARIFSPALYRLSYLAALSRIM